MRKTDSTGSIQYDNTAPVPALDAKIAEFKDIFENDATVKYRMIGVKTFCCAVFVEGLVDADSINHYIVQPLCKLEHAPAEPAQVEDCLHINELTTTGKYSKAVEGVLGGDTVLLFEGISEIFVMNTRGFAVRSINEPDNEKVLYGPREGFNESIIQSIAMLRRKIQTSDFKAEFLTVGTRTNTKACICYLDNLVNRAILEELKRRIDKICVDSVLDSHTITEYISDAPYSIFPTVGKTERPDTAAAKLMDGGAVVILDGTPVVLMVPYFFVENFTSNDDYYLGFYYSSISRLLRYLAFFISISAGALYIAVVAIHPEMLSTFFMLTISSASAGMPFPSLIEFLLLMTLFEILRETGIRMSTKIGQALSIVGALVVGQAAVEARIISAPMVIVVATSAITGLIIPRLSAVSMIMRVISALAAAWLGIYGYCFAILGMCIHLFLLRSFGIQYTAHLLPRSNKNKTDTFIRAPMPFLKKRTKFLAQDENKSRPEK